MVLHVFAELVCSTDYPLGLVYDPNMSEAKN
jgi:hypothetical protein